MNVSDFAGDFDEWEVVKNYNSSVQFDLLRIHTSSGLQSTSSGRVAPARKYFLKKKKNLRNPPIKCGDLALSH